jgi:hypothetical protein
MQNSGKRQQEGNPNDGGGGGEGLLFSEQTWNLDII